MIRVADCGEGGRPEMLGIVGGLEVLEPIVVRDVNTNLALDDGRVDGALTALGAVGTGTLEVEPAHESSPGDPVLVEQVADVPPEQSDLVEGLGALVVSRIDIVDQRVSAMAVGDLVVAIDTADGFHAIRLPGDDFDGARCRGPVGKI